MYGMAAMKSGDTEWESFGLSKEVFENNEKFFNSTDCLLSTSEQLKQKIDIEKDLRTGIPVNIILLITLFMKECLHQVI
ncbi:hypothetical protein GQR86_10960 [Providencia vermicola]|nr:hypothetical protein [Providencia sp. G1(2023)]MBC8653565.1 hypothetical protein [Providencia vermicola]